ncbi:hypothetical protein R3P38DRAFT_3536840 [Favolaschia claudopus]|uniref:Uncharacterized protein n=1 Tax=Favolaschia claudopus TaxID=2862362 RepID=A0AAW0BB99_9AGAR
MANWANVRYQQIHSGAQNWNPSNRRRQILYISLGVFAFFLLLGIAHPTTRKLGKEYYNEVIPSADSNTKPAKEEEPVLKLPGPPTYETLKKWEDDLPQHNLDLPFPEGKTGRYVKFSNQMNFVGWNNCLNERLMNAHLAYMSKRAYVFNEYVWAQEHYPWPPVQQPPGGPRTPLNAIISGPMAGGPWDEGDDAPRSISERWFDVVCPKDSRHIIHTEAVKPALKDLTGSAIFAHWQDLLLNLDARCVEIVPAPWDVDSMPQIFDLWIWGSDRVLSLWDAFSHSPTSRLLGPSPIVQAAIDRNTYLFLPRGPRPPHPAPRDVFARMLAMHLRRGDYLAHCTNLANWGSTYYSWAQLPAVVDRFAPLPADDPKRVEAMLAHCLPNNAQIVQKIKEVREDYVNAKAGDSEGRTLDVLYLLTNEQGAWLDEVKADLRKAGWYTIVTTRDLQLDQEQTDVSMAIDMQMARKAAVFIGNGWSSFTSNIIHQRFVDGREPISIRLT